MENVGALSFRGLDAVLGSLAEIGYDAEWCDIRASDIGAHHRRERLWIVAYPNGSRLEKHGLFKSDLSIGSGETRTSNKPEESENDVGYPHSMRMERQGAKFQTARTGRTGKDVADTSSKRLERRKETILKEEGWHSDTGYDRKKIGSSWRNSQWDSEPDVGRVANGVPSRVDRLKCLGNSIVPQIAELIFEQAVFDLWRTV
jgi:DNA (cytosine-5)-methyltransferase 1